MISAIRGSKLASTPICTSSLSGPRDFVAQISARRLARDAPNHLADQVSERDRMIAVRGPRLPPRLLRRERRAHNRPVGVSIGRQLLPHSRQSRAMTQQIIYRNLILPRLRKLRPVFSHGRIKVELPLIDQPMRTDRRNPLGSRPDIDESIARPRPGLSLIGIASPKIKDGLPINHSRHRSPYFDPMLKTIRKNLSDPLKPRLASPFDLHCHTLSPTLRSNLQISRNPDSHQVQ